MNQFLISTALTLILLFSTFGILVLLSKRYRGQLGIDPMSDELLRPAGESCRIRLMEIIDQQNEHLAFLLISCVALGLVPLLNLPILMKITSAVILAALLLWQISRLAKSLKQRWHYELGFEGERFVGQYLNALVADGYSVFHDLPCSAQGREFNIDHVVVGRTGVYTVETKTRRKPTTLKGKAKVTVTYDGKKLIFPTFSDQHGLRQVFKNNQYLSNLLTSSTGDDVAAKPVLVLPGWYVVRQKKEPVTVVNPKQFGDFLSGQQASMTDAEIMRAVHQLTQLCKLPSKATL